jgi:glycosyltransferase involved in cell wall biosynthesis
MMIHVSVIMPVHNAEAFVAEAIESVLAQTYPHWELIIVDDGSTDASPEVLKRYVDPRILMIRQENKGEGGARNTGLDIACGTCIGFLDADDLYLPTALADFVAYFEAHSEAGVVFSDGYFCDEQKRPLMRFGDHRPGEFTGNILEPLVLCPSVVSVPTMMMVRRSTLEACEARFDTSLKYGVDWDFWTQLARFVQFGHLSSLTALYRVHAANMTSATTLRKRKNDLAVGRLKIMNAEWFAELSLQTRRSFFYYLLVGLLGDQPAQQRNVIDAAPFGALPPDIQAGLLQQVASDHLSKQKNVEFALGCLKRSLSLQPDRAKSRALLQLGSRSPALAAAVLSMWQVCHRTAAGVRSLGRRKPRAVPAALLPASE